MPPTSGTQCEVYRDLQVLERVGVPIYQERQGRRARWRVMEGYRRSLSITLSWPEMMALVLGRKRKRGKKLERGVPGAAHVEAAWPYPPIPA